MIITDTFDNRMWGADGKERADATTLEQQLGCKVYRFGQGQLPSEARDALRKFDILIRWLVDLLVICADGRPLMVDSKSGRKDTQYWVLEKRAHEAHRLQQVAFGVQHVYIWPDGCSCSYVDDLPDEKMIRGPRGHSGSGTPYWLVPKTLTRPLDDVFGKDIWEATA